MLRESFCYLLRLLLLLRLVLSLDSNENGIKFVIQSDWKITVLFWSLAACHPKQTALHNINFKNTFNGRNETNSPQIRTNRTVEQSSIYIKKYFTIGVCLRDEECDQEDN